MAETAVFHLLAKLAPFLQGEVNLLSGVREAMEDIRDEFERMSAFLRVADAKEESDPQLKVWVKQVRDAAYDTEDVLDKFKLHLAHHHGDGFGGFLRKVFYLAKTLKARHQIAFEIQRIKSRVINISEGHKRYHDKYGILEQGSRSNVVNNSWYDYRGDALLLEEAKLVGIEMPKRQLMEWLVQGGSGLKAISVVGMGGLGKTTLVKKVYDAAAVKKHFNSHAWLTVSESFGVEDLLKDMIQQLFREIMQPVPVGVETMSINRLKCLANDFLQQRRYVVVFDDVWNVNAWEAIKYVLPNNNCGSRVILTTRFTHIASTCCEETNGHVYDLMPLSQEESWTLFCNKTFRGNLCPPNLKQISLRILKRCEGLPLAIVVISGVLATKDRSRIDEWEMLYRSLGAELEGNDKLKSMKKALSLSYNDLPHYLKICFLYLSIFPEDQKMWSERIIRLWTAEGFVNAIEGKTIEEVAKGYLDELFNRSLIQVAKRYRDGRPSHFCIHDLMREIIVSKAREQNIVTTICRQGSRRPEKVRRLLIRSTSDNVEYSERSSQLRSLFVWGPMDSLPIASLRELFSRSSRLLNVLDFECTPLDTIPNEVFKLIHLRYLGLRNTKVKMVPKLIGKLEKLETLDLIGTYVTELPDEILHLQKLRNLLSYYLKSRITYFEFGDIRGIKAPSQIGSLQSLQVLVMIEVDQRSEGGVSIVKELGRLTQLRELSIRNLRREDGVTLCSSIEKLSNLRRLDIISTKEDEILDLQSLSLVPQFLNRLNLTGRLEKFPHMIPSLHGLVALYLRWSKLRDDPLQSLQELPNLAQLLLEQAYEGEGLCFTAGGFQRLKYLHLHKLKGLRWVRVEEGAMPHLQDLTIRNSELMEEVPSGIEHLTNLQTFELCEMSDKLISKLDREVQDEDYRNTAHIPQVRIWYREHDQWKVKFL
ncbi:Disease resistance protein RPM1 [Camellia lanceoleosa]|uniref:Disease resistance protein RPM1 n=1 Tax=Camellia lanceoleosa TaxID=1840588 RepID=A0ACC0FIF6_9ERIC|nr:Disease resistance protein RPM1 [Camellia lanceoleosa]